MNAQVKAISYYLPEKMITNKDLCDIFPSLNEDDLYKKTGIRKRHVTSKDLLGSDLAHLAAEKLFKEHNINKSSVDFLIFCTSLIDQAGPAAACILQHRLELSTNCGAIDITFGCTGFTYSLGIAKGLIESGLATNVLLLTAEVSSLVTHPDDSELRIIFGDAAAATLVSSEKESLSCIGNFSFGTDGSGGENLIVRRSGIRNPVDQEWLKEHEAVGGLKSGRLEMNAIEIFSFALRVVPPMFADVLKKNNLEQKDIDLFIFHQANGFLLSVLRRKLKISEDKFFTYIEEVGNTVSASIPIALCEAIKAGKAKKGQKIMLASFGIGYSWSGTIITL